MNFDGSILVRAQQPTAVTQLLNRKQPPTPGERNELLSFLASIVLSGKSGLKFDPTVPPRDLDNAQEACATLKMEGVSIVSPKGVDTESISKASGIAFQQSACSEKWPKILKEPEVVSTRFPSAEEKKEDIATFILKFGEIQNAKEDQEALIQLSHELSNPNLENANLWGNKLLAGMAMAQADYLKATIDLEIHTDQTESSNPVEQAGLALNQCKDLDQKYRLISALIVNFRDYLMPAIAGQYSCIYSSAKSIDYLGRLKFNQLAILNLIRQLRKDNHLDLAELQERLNSFDLENSFATNAMAHIGAHILQKADPRDRQHGLVTAALKVAEDDQFSALLRWVAKRQANWEEKLSDNMDLKEEALSLNQFVLETFKELQDPRKSVTEIVYEYSSVIAVGGVTSLIGMFALNPILAFSAGAASGLLAKLASRQDSPNSIPFINPRSRYLGALDLTLNDVIPAEKVDGRLKDIWS